MARQKKPRISVYKPRRHRQRWRIEIRDGVTGSRSRPSFDSEKEAWRAYRTAKREALAFEEPTVGEMIEAYREHQIEKGNRPSSYKSTYSKMNLFFEPCMNLRVSQITQAKAQKLYDRRRATLAVDSHRNELAEAKTFFRWIVKQGKLRNSPLEEIEPVGRRKKGKPQLRAGEAMAFLDRALELSAEGSDAAFAAAACLLMGLRAGEITRRVVRDVDPATHILHIEKAKTRAGNRLVEIPNVIWPHFEQRIADRDPMEPLLPSPRSDDGFHEKEWVGRMTKKICEKLELPQVCAHGLRGTHATLARQAGATGHLVAAALGHEDVRTTRDNYLLPGTTEKKRQEVALEVLTGGKAEGLK